MAKAQNFHFVSSTEDLLPENSFDLKSSKGGATPGRSYLNKDINDISKMQPAYDNLSMGSTTQKQMAPVTSPGIHRGFRGQAKSLKLSYPQVAQSESSKGDSSTTYGRLASA